MTAAQPGTAWTLNAVHAIARQDGWRLPVLHAGDVRSIMIDTVVWDMWQLMDERCVTVTREGRSLWFFLAAPRCDDPNERHDVARIRLTSHGEDGWRDHGAAFPEGLTPGSREWSGSAVLSDDGETVTMYFTAAGRRGRSRTFEQRLFESTGRLRMCDGSPAVCEWTGPVESVAADGSWYLLADQDTAVDDRIKGFRDPAWFRDPAEGAEYLLFSASAAWLDEVYDGVVGCACRRDGRWELLPPLVTALGVNSELERPHIVMHGGRYYLFWSTQAKRFSAVAGQTAPTGLYAMVADAVAGPWRPVNGTALVAGNPPDQPFQSYCWWVTGELDVSSFVDLWGLGDASPDAPQEPPGRHFGGAPAPFFRLRIDGDRITPEM